MVRSRSATAILSSLSTVSFGTAKRTLIEGHTSVIVPHPFTGTMKLGSGGGFVSIVEEYRFERDALKGRVPGYVSIVSFVSRQYDLICWKL